MVAGASNQIVSYTSCLDLHNIRRFLWLTRRMDKNERYDAETQKIVDFARSILFDRTNDAFCRFNKINDRDFNITRYGASCKCDLIAGWTSLVVDGWIQNICVLKWKRDHKDDEIVVKIDYDGELYPHMDQFLLGNGIQASPLKAGWDSYVSEPGEQTLKLLSLIMANYALPLEETFNGLYSSCEKKTLSPKIEALFEEIKRIEGQLEESLSKNMKLFKRNWKIAQRPFQIQNQG